MFDKEKQLEVINEKIKKLRVDRSKTKNEVRKCEINGEIEKLAKESKNIESGLKSSKLEELLNKCWIEIFLDLFGLIIRL